MDDGEDRPQPGPPPVIEGPLELLRYLLQIERERLEVAVEIERKREIVFPETSVIIHDIMKLQDAIERKAKRVSQRVAAALPDEDALAALLEEDGS